jgi:single-stranded-DNA-specific exonuclease
LRELAERLDRYNAERKAIEAMALEEAVRQAEACDAGDCVIVVAAEGWHPGVIGIVAGRLKERFDKPVAVIALKDGVGKASARSVPGVDLGAAVIAAVGAGVLMGGGGHAMAAGFTVAETHIPLLREFLNQYLAKQALARGGIRTLHIDAQVSIPAVNAALARLIEQAGPYGAGHPAPHFLLSAVRILRAEPVGDGHVRAILIDNAARMSGASASLKAMAFRSIDTPKGQALLMHRGRAAHIAGCIKLNSWQGRETADFIIEDLCWA